MRAAAFKYFAILLLFAAPAAAESDAAGHFTPAELPQSIIGNFIDAVTENEEWIVKPEEAGAPRTLTPEERFVWAGSEIKAEIVLGKPVITFNKNATDLAPAKSFTLEVGFGLSRMVLQSSAPGSAKMVHGVALQYSDKKPFRRFLAGSGDTGFVALIPKQENTDWYGIAICPRNRVDDKTAHTLLSTGYSADAVMAPVQGELSAKQRTGNAKGKIVGEVLTSPNIPRAVPFTREVVTENPILGIQYFADTSDVKAAATALPYAGILMRGRLTTPQKARRMKKIEAFVRAVPFTPIKPIQFSQDGNNYLIDAGECFAIIRGVFFEEEFKAK